MNEGLNTGDFDFTNPPPGFKAMADQIEAQFSDLLSDILTFGDLARIELDAGNEMLGLQWLARSRHAIQEQLHDESDYLRFIAFLSAQIRSSLEMIDDLREQLGEDRIITLKFTTGTGQVLQNVHAREVCKGPWCAIHTPCPGPWDTWPTNWRGDGPQDIWTGFERICPHGVGHTAVEESMRGNHHAHGCDGCPCSIHNCEPVYGSDNQIIGYEVKK